MVAPQHTEGKVAAQASLGLHFEATKSSPSSQSLTEKTSPQVITDIQSSVDTGADAVDEYPHGIRLVLLAGASIMGVFLISLDQVCSFLDYKVSPWTKAHHVFSPFNRQLSVLRFRKLPPSLMVSRMYPGTRRPTS